MSVTMHKKSSLKITSYPEELAPPLNNNEEPSASTKSSKEANDFNITATTTRQLENIERENRLSSILRLHTRGLNQEQIAQELHIHQSTVSRDLHFVQQESKKHVEKYMR